MSSGERRVYIAVEKEGRFFDRAVIPLSCSNSQEKRKQECVLYCAVAAARV